MWYLLSFFNYKSIFINYLSSANYVPGMVPSIADMNKTKIPAFVDPLFGAVLSNRNIE